MDGVFGFVGGVDFVGQFALASITDPSGHVFVVGGVDGGTDVKGGVVVDGVNDWVHDGSFGFFLQSTIGGMDPEVQLYMHDGPAHFRTDAATLELFVVKHVPL